MKQVLILFLAVVLFSCSPEARLVQLLKNHPELVSSDTINEDMKVKIDGVMREAHFKNEVTKDTIFIKDRQLTIKYFNDGKTIYLKGICEEVYRQLKIPVSIRNVNPIKEVIKVPWWGYPTLAISIIAIAMLGLYITRKK